jgi:type IV pilus assembly protein PilY1
MTIQRKYLDRLIQTLAMAALVALPGLHPAHAKDTDVYLMSPTVARDDSPNVMIVFDNSGSMNTNIGSTRPPYDSSINYCTDDLDTTTGITGANGGKPGNCASISGRVFWTMGNNPTPPSTTSNRWFATSKNNCLDSTSALASSGFYGTTKIARWSDSGDRNWRTLSGYVNSDIIYVDCLADGTANGQAAGDNTFPRNSNSVAYTSISGQAFNWTSFNTNSSPTLYSSNYMNYWNNSALSTTLTRLSVAKSAVKSIIDANKSVRFGLTVFNDNNSTPHGGRVIMRVETMSDTRRTLMKNVVDALTANSNTPLAETLWEVYRYYGGLSVDYGNPTSLQTPHQDSCAQNVTSSFCDNGALYRATNGQYSDSSGVIVSGAPVDASYNDGGYISPFKFGCQTAYIIYVTDGDPTSDTDADGTTRIKSLSGLSSCDGSSCLDDLAGWMHDNDVYGGLGGKQVVNTYTIGFGGGISAAGLALLQQTASKGGGTYYTADNADQLSNALQGALTEILTANTSFTAPSLSVNAFNKLYNRDDVYFALFKPSSSMGWDGNIKRFRLCNTTDATTYGCTFGEVIDSNNAKSIDSQTSKIKDTAVSFWSASADGAEVTKGGAGSKITDNTRVPRTLYTYRGSYAGLSSSSPATPVTVVAATGNSVHDAAVITPTILGLPAAATPSDVAKLINWMRGQDTYDKNGNCPTGTTYSSDPTHTCFTETRPWNFADPLHSRPVAVTYGAENDGFGNPDPDKPIIKLFVGTNDGMVRIINNNTGVEEWAFIPKEMLDKQAALAQDADGGHIYGMDDSPAFLFIDNNNDAIIDPAANDKVYMFIGMRRGVNATGVRGNIYGFDVTPTSKMTSPSSTVTPKLMWVIEGGSGDYAQLGQTWSRPKVARIRAKCTGSVCNDGDASTDDSESRTALIFGGGYDINQDNAIPAGTDSRGNAIYIASPFDGSRIWWASSNTGANLVLPGMTFSIPSEVAALDTNGDKSVDRVYVGDTGGQVWRIDLGDQLGAAGTGGSSGFKFADVGCTGSTRGVACSATAKQDLRKFFYSPDVAQVKDTVYSSSADYDLVTIGSGDREDPLDLLTTNTTPSAVEAVHNRIYAFRDYNFQTGAAAGPPAALTDADLYDATANNLGTLTGAALQTEIDNNVKTKSGWYFDLKEANNITLTNGLTTKWVGEKVLAKTLIYNGVLFFTTFIPANDSTAQNTCQANEGEGRFYEVNLLSGAPMYDLNGDNSLDRFGVAGGGIPSEVIIVIRDGGVTGLVGTSGGAKQVNPGGGVNRYKTYWYDE